MQIFAIVVSVALSVAGVGLVAYAARGIVRVIRLGTPVSRRDHPGARTVTMLKETVGHTRMLQWTVVGVMHWFVFAAFIFLSTAVAGAYFQLFEPSFAWPIVGHWYPFEWFSEFIGALSTVGIIYLIIYRLRHLPSRLGRGSRFFGSTMWQAYFVEYLALFEGSAIVFIRGAEYNLDPHATRAHYPLASWIGDLYPASEQASHNIIYLIAMLKIAFAMVWLIVIARNLTMGVAWHRFTAWFNIWFKRESSGRTALGALKPLLNHGRPVTLDDIDDLDEDATLGVGAVEDFSWKGILDFTTCTECGRCQSQCPAWNTEKPLSPKLLVMGLREHAYAKAAGEESHTGRSLVGKSGEGDWFYNPEGGDFVIDQDVLWSCTSCGACVQQCPVDIEHVDHIVDMRRYQVLVESNFPTELNQLFKGLENKGNPWNMAPSARMDWAKDLPFEVKQVGKDLEDLDSVDWLFWVGCAGAYEDRAKKTTRAVAELLDLAGVSFGVLGNGETCTGDPARRAGNEFVFQGLAQQNVETFTQYRVKKVVSTCAHCFNTLKNEYQDFGIELEVVHHTQLLNRLVREGRLTPLTDGAGATKRSITYHDPCYLGRHNQVYTPPRELLQVLPGAEITEMPRNSERSFCCGAGGARMWMEENLGERINLNRTTEAIGTGADQIAVGCPFCRVMLSDGLTALQAKQEAREEVEVLDIAQMLLASVKGETATRVRKTTGTATTTAADAAGLTAATSVATSVATAAEPAAGDLTQTTDTDTHTDTQDVGPAAKASSGASLFDTPAQEPTTPAPASGSLFDTPTEEPAKPTTGGSLFDTPAQEPAKPTTGGSLFDTPAQEPAKPTTGGGSLFDTPTEEPAKPTSGGSLFDTPAQEPAKPTSGGSLFDTPADQPPAEDQPAAPASGGSLFDIPADEPGPKAPAATAPTAAAHAEPVTEPEAASEPATAGVSIDDTVGSGGSLFDIPDQAPPSAPATRESPAPGPDESESAAEPEPAAESTSEPSGAATEQTEPTGSTTPPSAGQTPPEEQPDEQKSLFDY